MLKMIRQLFQHQSWADACILTAVRAHAEAESDNEMRKNLHHIVLVQRYFLSRVLERPFAVEKEMQIPSSFDELETLFQETHREEAAMVDALEETCLSRTIELPHLKDLRPSLAEALMQVVMHSQHHRGQCASRLRGLGATPPTMDFILWLNERAAQR